MLPRASKGTGPYMPRKLLRTIRVRQWLLNPGVRGLVLGKAGEVRQSMDERHMNVTLERIPGQLQGLGKSHRPNKEKA